MNRAVVVLLLLIANAIVSSSRKVPTIPARAAPHYSLGLFTVLDGASLEHGRPGCAAPVARTEADACVPHWDLRL